MFRLIKKIRRNKSDLNIGKNTRILTSINNFGSEPYLVKIGNNCTITSGVKFVTHDASIDIVCNYKNINRVQGENIEAIMGEIRIGNNCMIGVNSIIMPNVTIGDNCIIGAGSVVTNSFESGSVIAGNPAKLISDIETYSSKAMNKAILISNTRDYEKRKKDILLKLGLD